MMICCLGSGSHMSMCMMTACFYLLVTSLVDWTVFWVFMGTYHCYLIVYLSDSGVIFFFGRAVKFDPITHLSMAQHTHS